MSTEGENFDPDDYEGVQPKLVQLQRSQIRALEKKAKRADEAETELAQLRRERAFLKAGISDDGKLGTLFMNGYTGQIDDADALRAAAIEFGVLQPPQGQQEATEQSLAGHQAAVNAAAGAQPATPAGTDLQAQLADIRKRYPLGGLEAAAEVARIAHEHGLDAGIAQLHA